MTLQLLEMPDDLDEIASWLERQLVGVHLRALVVELSALQPATPSQLSLTDIMPLNRTELLAAGLMTLDREQIGQLLRHPRTLLELQQLILDEGGDYWEAVPCSDAHRIAAETVTQNVLREIKRFSDIDDETTVASKPTTGVSRRLWIPLAIAASVLATMTLVMWPEPAHEGWGFNRPGLLTAEVSREKFLFNLADAGKAWFNASPQNKQELIHRLRQFKNGCQKLIETAPYRQLPEHDNVWLVERCRAWQRKIDGHITALDTDQRPFDDVQDEANATIERLIAALSERASA